jgi:L-threonylcarbamoyladenylate synthase
VAIKRNNIIKNRIIKQSHKKVFSVQTENGKKTENEKKIKTQVFSISEKNFDIILEKAADIIRKGGTIAFPTETVYGLGANGLDPKAVKKIFEAKARPPGNPLSLLVHSREDLEKIARKIPEKAFKLMEAFWPGPLTIILEKTESVPSITSGNLPSVGVRMPDHNVPLKLIQKAGVPLAAPSANLSGRPSPSSAAHVLADLAGRVDAIIDGGDADIGLESTVIDMTVEPPLLLRPGAIGRGELEALIGPVREKNAEQKYTHYTPDTPVVLVEGNGKFVSEKLKELLETYMKEGKKVGLLLTKESWAFLTSKGFSSREPFLLGGRKETEEAAKKLFEGLRALDLKDFDVILADGSFSMKGLGAVVLNRLREAASLCFTSKDKENLSGHGAEIKPQQREEEGIMKENEEQDRLKNPGVKMQMEEKGEEKRKLSNSVGMEFVKIPSGEFLMGSNDEDIDRQPVHKVTIKKPFLLGKYPVTQEQWIKVMGLNPSYFRGNDLPVEEVSWNDVQKFIQKLNQMEGTDEYRLPSEAEWEYACRAGTKTRYSFGDDESKLEEYAWYSENSDKTQSIGQKKPNSWGLYDIHGNVCEWCQDKYHDNYSGAPSDGSAWEEGRSSDRVDRGGSWVNLARTCQSAYTGGDDPRDRRNFIGFRVLRKL